MTKDKQPATYCPFAEIGITIDIVENHLACLTRCPIGRSGDKIRVHERLKEYQR